MSLANVLNADSQDCFETKDLADMAETVVHDATDGQEMQMEEDDSDTDGLSDLQPSCQEKIRALRLIMKLNDEQEWPNLWIQTCLRSMKNNIAKSQAQSMRQTTIDPFFARD